MITTARTVLPITIEEKIAQYIFSLKPDLKNSKLFKDCMSWDFGEVIQKAEEKTQNGELNFNISFALIQFRLWLYIVVSEWGNRQILPIPGSEVDEIWHLAILETKNYHQLCAKLGTPYIHHKPHSLTSPKLEMSEKREILIPLSIKHFGEVVFDLSDRAATSYKWC
jgi:hypothetical protein